MQRFAGATGRSPPRPAETRLPSIHGSVTVNTDGEILTVKDLNVAYGESKVLFDAHLGVKPGQLVTCVGRNGAGKTTLLKSIAGFLKPTSGSRRHSS